MNRTLVLATALAAGLAASPLFAQAPATAAAPAAARAEVPPQAIPAKIAVIAFEQGVMATNEGQKANTDLQKKYEPQKNSIDAKAAEIESLKKQFQALPATLSDEERANREKNIDTKQKELQRDAEDAQTSYNNDLQEAYGKVAQKFGGAAVKYCQENGFTLLLNESPSQQGLPPVLWAQPSTDITQAVINAYNVASGVPAPAPSAPTPHRTAPSTTPRKQ